MLKAAKSRSKRKKDKGVLALKFAFCFCMDVFERKELFFFSLKKNNIFSLFLFLFLNIKYFFK